MAELQRGVRVSIHDCKRLGIGALTQRISELRRLGFDIRDDWGRVKGERQAWKIYWLAGAQPMPQPKTQTIVREHVRQIVKPTDDQMPLFG